MFFLEFLLESSLLVLMILGIRKVFTGKIRYAGIYALWLLALLRFLIPVNVISTPFSAGMLLPRTAAQTEENPAGGNPGQAQYAAGQPGYVFSDEKSGESVRTKKKEDLAPAALSAQGLPANQSGGSRMAAEGSPINWHALFAGIWLAGSGILLLWFAISNISLMIRLRRSRRFYGKRGGVKIYVAPLVKNPCLYGFFRPAVYLPESLFSDNGGTETEEEEREQIITHEYVHYRHGDHIWAMFRVILVVAYWFDPFLWLAVSCSRKDAELFCDETVIRLLGEKKRFSYGRLLIRLAGDSPWGEFRYPLLSMSRRGREMANRIHAIGGKRNYSRWKVLPLVLLAVIAAGITCSAGSVPSQGGERASEEKSVTGSAVSDSEREDARDKDGAETAASTEGKKQEDMPDAKPEPAAIEKAFGQYIQIFTDAVNTGNTDKLRQIVYTGSDMYRQQYALAKNYYKRGIREKIKSCSVSSFKIITPTRVMITSKEKIKVSYVDGSRKMIRQKYQYTCDYIAPRWMITGMEEIPSAE